MPESLVVGGTTYDSVDYVRFLNGEGEEVNYYQGLTEQDKAEIAAMVQVDSENVSVPEYWEEHLEGKANEIQAAMEKAGKNKSAFLWYTDAHWVNGNSKVSPKLLHYLYMNTPMSKVNFGGDIIGDSLLSTREQMRYLYEWRKAIKNLPNHHSVLGNHDMFNSDSVDYEDNNYRYAFMLAPEETSDMVMGDGNYYYIDNHCEKTRYLHLGYMDSDHTAMTNQGKFIVDAISSVSEGWHIVAIAHRWWQYTSSSAPTVGSVPNYEKEILKIFDEYNARTTHTASNYFSSQNFASAKGKVEFCIGGHIHIDYDFETAGGIPVIITTSDTNQNRVPDSSVDSGAVGTTTESAVFGIIADYNDASNPKITVVGVGRGTSRVVRKSAIKPASISNISYSGDTTEGSAIDKSMFSFTVNYNNGTTDTITGATSVSPTTISIGNNSVTVTYVENGTTLTGTITIVGKAKPVVNLFNKNDPDMLDRGRINSSHAAVAYADNQLVTGYIEAKIGDTFTVKTDLANTANNYVGAAYCWNSSKAYVGGNIEKAVTAWSWNDDYTEGTLTIPAEYRYSSTNIANFEGTAYIRFCLAYTNMDNIVITKA